MSEMTTTNETNPVRRAVTIATRRLRQRRTLRFAATGLLGGSLVGFFVAVLLNLNVLQETTLPGYGAFLILPSLVGLVTGVAMGVAGKYSPVSVARLLENRLDLKDRLSTALGANDGHPLTQAQRADAMRNAPGEADVFRAIPITPVPRRVYVAAAVSLAVILTYFAPELPVFWNPARRAEQTAVRKEGDRLLKIAKAASAEAKKQNLPEAEKAAQKVEKLGSEMTRGRMRLRDALIERAKLNDELRKAQDKVAQEQAKRSDQELQKKLAATSRDLNKNLSNNKSEPSDDKSTTSPDSRMKSLQDAMARGDKKAVAQILREMADAADKGEPKPGAERDKMSRQIAALSDALNKNNMQNAGQSAQSASDSLKQNAMPDAAQNLRETANRIEQDANNSQNNANQNQNGQSGSQSSSPSRPQREQNLMDKIESEIQRLSGGGQQGGAQQSGQQSQGSQGQQPSNSAQGQNGQQGQLPQSGNQQGSGSQNSQSGKQGKSGQSSQSGQSGQNGKNGSQGGKQGSGSGNKPGQSQGAGQGKSGGNGKNGNKGGSSNGAGQGSTGSAKTGSSTARIGKDAAEQNVHTKRSGDGPETVVTEKDTDHSALPASSLPYYNEFVKKRTGPASESAQGGENVPQAYKNQVRGYFDALPGPTRPDAKGQ